jgi:hypothetical protein
MVDFVKRDGGFSLGLSMSLILIHVWCFSIKNVLK